MNTTTKAICDVMSFLAQDVPTTLEQCQRAEIQVNRVIENLHNSNATDDLCSHAELLVAMKLSDIADIKFSIAMRNISKEELLVIIGRR